MVGKELVFFWEIEGVSDFFCHPLEGEPEEEPFAEFGFRFPLPTHGLNGSFCPIHEGRPFATVEADHFSEIIFSLGERIIVAHGVEAGDFGRFQECRDASGLHLDVFLHGFEETFDADEGIIGDVAFDDTPGFILSASVSEDIFGAEDFDVQLSF